MAYGYSWRREWQSIPVGYSPWGRKESDMTEQLTHTHGYSLGFNFTCVLARWSLLVSLLWREQ